MRSMLRVRTEPLSFTASRSSITGWSAGHERIDESSLVTASMQRAINKSVGLFAEVFEPAGPVVELGSYFPPDWESLCDLRPYFPGREYIGCDLRAGRGVDRIEDAERLTFDDSSVGTVLMFELLEHVRHPSAAIAEAHRVLREDGLLALSTPFSHPLHAFPDDYWRFTASGMHTLLAPFEDKVIFSLGPALKPAFIFAVGAKRGSDRFADRGVEFRALVDRTFRSSRFEGHISVLKRTGRDLVGQLLRRARLGVAFYDPCAPGGYFDVSSRQRRAGTQTESPRALP